MFKALKRLLKRGPRKDAPGTGVGPPSAIGIQSTDINDVLDVDGNPR